MVKVSRQLGYLLANERLALQEYTERLTKFLGEEIRHLWLFGSKARGDFDDDSDIDVLIVLRHLDPDRRSVIRRMAARVSLDYDILINTHILEEAQWEKAVRFQGTIWREIERDGVSLLQPEPVR
jgi:predicted nucleotidyltransferase